MTLDATTEALIKSVCRSMQEEADYIQAVHATPEGQRSDGIRWRAKALRDSGQIEPAYQCYLQAEQCHAPDDRSAAAAGARQDLADVLISRRLGLHRENLLRAAAFCRLAMRSPERERNLCRAAMTRSTLATCLRYQAEDAMLASSERQRLLQEAHSLIEAAIGIDTRRGPAGLWELIGHENTLANLLDQQGKSDAALRRYRRIEQKYGEFADIQRQIVQLHEASLPSPVDLAIDVAKWQIDEHIHHNRPLILLNVATAYLGGRRRNPPSARDRGLRLLRLVIAEAPHKHVARARLFLAQTLIDAGAHDEASTELDQVGEEELPPEMVPELATAYKGAGKTDAALLMLHKIIDHSIKERRDSETDHASDQLAVRAQHAANLAAEFLIERGDHVGAFLALENVAGMRFEEAVRIYSFRPRDPIGYRLWATRASYSTAAAMLFSLASQSLYVPEERRAEYWREITKHYLVTNDATNDGPEDERTAALGNFSDAERRTLQQARARPVGSVFTPPDDDWVKAPDLFAEHLKAALQHKDPVADLHRRAQGLIPALRSLDQAVAEIEGDNYVALTKSNLVLTPSTLRELLDQYPEYVFIHLTIAGQTLSAVAIWLAEGKITGRAVNVIIPAGLFAQLYLLHEHPERADVKRLQKELAQLDISSVFPPQRVKRAVLLPSSGASFLPLGALGPAGRMPIDLCAGLLWLPCLAPLRCPQAPLPPRAGLLVVTPESTAADGHTRLHNEALVRPLAGEERLRGADASLGELMRRAGQVRAICFYTHGVHKPQDASGPYIALHDGRLHRAALDSRWLGVERVELWACQTGVSLPTDPLTPPGVDDGFGFDVDFLKAGVRSTIGTLWPVWEVVTACLVRRYRELLADALDPPEALVAAQRFWRDVGLPALMHALSGPGSPDQRLQRFWEVLGIPAPPIDAEMVLSALGASRAESLDEIHARFSNPTAWGGFRFMGCPEAHVGEPWDPGYLRPLTDEERGKLQSFLAELRQYTEEQSDSTQNATAATDQSLDDNDDDDEPGEHALSRALGRAYEYDEKLDERLATSRQCAMRVTAAQALQVARLYRDRVRSAHLHNLLAGLAWIHEVLADPVLAEDDRAALCLEAAHLWLDVAQGEAVSNHDFFFGVPRPVALGRARSLLAARPDQPSLDWLAAKAMLELLITVRRREGASNEADFAWRMQPDEAVIQAWELIAPHLPAAPAATYENRRALKVLCDLLAFAPAAAAAACTRVRDLAAALLKEPCLREELPVTLRLAAAVAWLGSQLATDPSPFSLNQLNLLTPSEAARAAHIGMTSTAKEGWFAVEAHSHILSHALSRLEAALWGTPKSDRREVWHNTGSAGPAYRMLAAAFMTGAPGRPPLHQRASHLFGGLQLLCDLRLMILNRSVRMHGFSLSQREQQKMPRPLFWSEGYYRERALDALIDTTFQAMPEKPGSDDPHPLDPYALSIAQIRSRCRGPQDLTAWELQETGNSLDIPELVGVRTAAFHLVHGVELMTKQIDEQYNHFLKEQKTFIESDQETSKAYSAENSPIARIYDPEIRIKDWEERLQQLPAGSVLIGLLLGPAEIVVAMACWRLAKGPGQKVVHSELGLGLRVRGGLAGLLMPQRDDVAELRGRSGERAQCQALLAEALEPLLTELLGPLLTAPDLLDIAVLAPGAMRPLPLFALRVGGLLLADRCRSLRHVPALGFWTHQHEPPARPRTACLLAACPAADGDTQCGAAAVQTLRAAFRPAQVLDVNPLTVSNEKIVEVDHIAEHAENIQCLRMYGVGSVYSQDDTTAWLVLAGEHRAISPRNVFAPLVNCDTVEIWAATSGRALLQRLFHEGADRIPGLAHSYLTCGAATVLDLAWPVLDLVKALVYERYGLLRRCWAVDGATALAEAVRQIRKNLRDWQAAAAGFRDIKAALEFLDKERQAAMQRLRLDPNHVVPFAHQTAAPSLAGLSVQALIAEAGQPVHLAAFRFWGGI